MVESHFTDETQKAEKIKQLGNKEFKAQSYHDAIKYYTEALEIAPHETIFSNRAASFIAIKEFTRAMEDC